MNTSKFNRSRTLVALALIALVGTVAYGQMQDRKHAAKVAAACAEPLAYQKLVCMNGSYKAKDARPLPPQG